MRFDTENDTSLTKLTFPTRKSTQSWAYSSEQRKHENIKRIKRAVALAIRNVLRESLTDVFPTITEVTLLLRQSKTRKQIANRVIETVAQGSFGPDQFHQVELMEIPNRQRGTRRVCASIKPFDAVVYLALAILAAPSIERRRVPGRRQKVFSSRFAPKYGQLFDRRYCYASFMEAVQSRLEDRGCLVKCDVKGFYSSVTPELPHEALTRCNVTPFVRDYIIDLLKFWARSGLEGLPIGSNASRILAEAVLISTDDALHAQGIGCLRFVDDFFVFTEDAESAHQVLNTLQDVLADAHFEINEDKTYILKLPQSRGAKLEIQSEGDQYEATIGDAADSDKFSSFQEAPKHFRPANSHEIARMCAVAEVPNPSALLDGPLAPRWFVQHSLRRALYFEHVNFINGLPDLVGRYPELTDYVVSGLLLFA